VAVVVVVVRDVVVGGAGAVVVVAVVVVGDGGDVVVVVVSSVVVSVVEVVSVVAGGESARAVATPPAKISTAPTPASTCFCSMWRIMVADRGALLLRSGGGTERVAPVPCAAARRAREA
jgi:hypothetical protein